MSIENETLNNLLVATAKIVITKGGWKLHIFSGQRSDPENYFDYLSPSTSMNAAVIESTSSKTLRYLATLNNLQFPVFCCSAPTLRYFSPILHPQLYLLPSSSFRAFPKCIRVLQVGPLMHMHQRIKLALFGSRFSPKNANNFPASLTATGFRDM